MVTKHLTIITEATRDSLLNLNIVSHLQQKICRNCLSHIRKLSDLKVSSQHETPFGDSYQPPFDKKLMETSLASINDSLTDVTSPLKADEILRMPLKRRGDYVQEKVSKKRKNLLKK